MRARRQSGPRYGLTLVEAILLLVIVSIVAVAAGVGLQAVVKVPAQTDDMMAINSVLVSGMEQMKAQMQSSSTVISGSTYFGWPSTSGATRYNPTFVTRSLGSAQIDMATQSALNTTDGTAWSTTLQTSAATVNSSSLAINGKYYYMTITLAKADPATGLITGNVQDDYLKMTAQLVPVTGTNATTTMVTYVTQP